MRIGVIADTHIPDRAECIPKQVLEDFKHTDMVIHAGDLVDLAALEELKTVCKNVKAVWGNMDSYEARSLLPEKEVLRVCGRRIGVIHGSGAPSALMEILGGAFGDEQLDIIIFGHTHCPFNEKRGGTLYFNPGSPTDKIFCPYNSYGIIEINDKIEAKIIRL